MSKWLHCFQPVCAVQHTIKGQNNHNIMLCVKTLVLTISVDMFYSQVKVKQTEHKGI